MCEVEITSGTCRPSSAIKAVHMAKKWELESIVFCFYGVYSVSLSLLSRNFAPHDPSFYAIFWGHSWKHGGCWGGHYFQDVVIAEACRGLASAF